MRRTGFRISVALSVALVIAGTATAATPVKIIDTRADESRPSVADGWAAWTANTLARPKAFHGYVRSTGGSIRKIPIRGDTFVGNIITDGPHAGQVVVWTNASGNGNIRFYDLTSRLVSNPPAGVNTTKKERDPSVSGDYLAFVRGPGNLMLYQFSTGTLVRLVAGGVYHPQVNGDYVGFGRCIGTTVASCKVVDRYRISTMKTKKMPAPGIGRANYYGAVATDGTMYWVEGSTKICGKKVKIRRWQSGVVSTVWGAPPGVEAAYLQADVLGTTPTLAFARYVCSSKNFGAYKLSV